jgi:hypothetical protein
MAAQCETENPIAASTWGWSPAGSTGMDAINRLGELPDQTDRGRST